MNFKSISNRSGFDRSRICESRSEGQASFSDHASRHSCWTRSSYVSRRRTSRALRAVDEDLGGAGAGVVVGGHDHAVGPGREGGQQVAAVEPGQGTVLGQEVAALADRADHVPGLGARRSPPRSRRAGPADPAGTATGQIRWNDSYRAGRIRSFIAASWIRNRFSPDCLVYNTRLTRMPALPAITRPGSIASRQPVALTAGTITRANSSIGLRLVPLVVDPEPAAHVVPRDRMAHLAQLARSAPRPWPPPRA